jgi:Zn-dependent protease with chaperone function
MIWWLIGGITLVLAVAGGIYWLFPKWILRRNNLIPLTVENEPEMTAYLASLCREVGLIKPPEFVIASSGDAFAFGRLGQYYVVLPAVLMKLFTTNRANFRATLLHELAHLANRDVNKTYFTIAIWRAFVTVALVPLIVIMANNLVFSGTHLSLENQSWRILTLGVLVYLTRNATLRAREVYADVRASKWDGLSGPLARMLAAIPHSRGKGRIVIGTHPDPGERFHTLHETHRLFRIGLWEAFGVGIAIGIALPIMQLILLLVAYLPGAGGIQNATRLETLGSALIFAPLAVGVVGLGAWRATFAARVREKFPTCVGRAGICLGLGITLGRFLSISNEFESIPLSFATVFIYDLPWTILLLVSLFFFLRWIAAGASAWLGIATTPRSLRLIYIVGLIIASMVLAAWLAELFGFSNASKFIREGGLTGFDSTLVLLALPAQFFNALLRPETLLVLISLWAFPLAAWFWRGRVRMVTASNWAFLDSPFQGLPWSRQEPQSPRFALTLGLWIGLFFCALLLIIRIGLRMGVPESIRLTEQYRWVFSSGQFGLALLLQGSITTIVASKVRQLGSLHSLFAAFVSGCVMTLGILDLNLLFGGTIDPFFTWQTFCIVVNGGALLALLVAGGMFAVVGWVPQTRRRQPQDYQPSTTYTHYPQYPYVDPSTSIYVQHALQNKKSNRFLGIALLAVGSLLLSLCCYCLFFYTNPPRPISTVTSTPATVLNTYCTSFKKGDYHTAYNQFSRGLQSQETEAEFTSAYTNFFAVTGGLKECIVSNVEVKNQLASGKVTLITGDGKRLICDCSLADAGDGWKIIALNIR